ncbi:MAG TPA: PQQ-dependent sugar dehydrogenase, partial [Acidimicrobiia bacterium]|nr:PQQ-dependent sugar dehydrogenase [Acidimicrobiia bacterium]
MRRVLIMLAFVLAACSADGEVEPSTAPQPSDPTVATTLAESSSSTATVAPTTTVASTTTTTVAVDDTFLAYQPVADMDFPVQLTARPGDTAAYVITKVGRVWLYDGAAVSEEPVLDISDQVRNNSEQGLLSIALHPEDPTLLYLHYSDLNGDTVVSEFALSSPTEAIPGSERVLLQVDQPAANHNGGMLQFMPDGKLLLGLGDGGGGGDDFGNGQNPDTLLGGLVVLDVAGEDPNPTKYAMGLRNPWRFWIDGTSIYVADVGQGLFEEVSVSETLEPGRNYGWPIYEGLHCYDAPICEGEGMVAPILEIRHGEAGTCSITGGVVYRGAAIPQLQGHYFYSDYCGGYLRSLVHSDGEATDLRDWTEQVGVPGQVTG